MAAELLDMYFENRKSVHARNTYLKSASLLFCLLSLEVFMPRKAMSKVGDPQPVVIGHVKYRSHANYVEALDTQSDKLLWHTVLYPDIESKHSNPSLEADAQWNIITSLKMVGDGLLEAQDGKGNTYRLNPKTGKVSNSVSSPDSKSSELKNRAALKTQLSAAFEHDPTDFLSQPLTFTYWLHGGEPGAGADVLEVIAASGSYRVRYAQSRFDGKTRAMKTERYEESISRSKLEHILKLLFESKLFEATYPTETKPNIADAGKETWELHTSSGDLQATFFEVSNNFPQDLKTIRTACKKLIIEARHKQG